NDNKNHSGGSTGGGGGGSSKVLCGSSVLISAKGGNGATASYVTVNNDGSGTTVGGGCSGTTSAVSLTDAVLQNEWNYSGSNSGDGYIVIRVVSILPMIELQANPSDWTNGDVTISAAVKNAGEGLPEEYLSWEQDEDGNDIWTSGEEFAASQNGTYTCKIRDTAGNVTQETVTITNIDKLPPEGEIMADITVWTVSDVVLTAAAEDAEENTEYGKSGLDDAAYLWGVEDTDGNIIWDVRQEEAGEEDQPSETKQSEAWTGGNSYTASQNGTYACRIRDKAGNVTECRYTVSNIDRTAPEIDYDRPDKWYDGENDITWIGNDLQPDGTEGSGLAEEAYSFDGVSFTALNTQRIPGAGVYKVWIRDKVGNTAEYEIEILYDRKPSSKGENISPDTPPVPVEQPPLPVIEPAGGGGNGGTDGSAALPEPIKVKQPQPEETLPILVPMPEPEPVKKQKTSSKIFPKEPELEISNKEIPQHSVMLPYIVGGTVSTGGMLYFILFFMAPIARIYELRAGRYIRKAWKFIMPGKKLDLRDCFENTEENKLIIRLGWLYSKRNRNHKITCIKLNGTEKIAIRTKTMIER
ncbi:MAG: hypothetical protein J6C33_09335, partial [Lachnospiraceae bacterium]|nr:hypothetical protein [Lachnospiraceae bacterium]